MELHGAFGRVFRGLSRRPRRRAAFKFQPPLLGSIGASPFTSNLVPSTAMVVYSALYALLALLLAQFLFSRRDL